MTTKKIKLKNTNGDYLEPYTTNVPDASETTKGLVQTESVPTANSEKVPTSGGVKTALDGKLDKTATAEKATSDASGKRHHNHLRHQKRSVGVGNDCKHG